MLEDFKVSQILARLVSWMLLMMLIKIRLNTWRQIRLFDIYQQNTHNFRDWYVNKEKSSFYHYDPEINF